VAIDAAVSPAPTVTGVPPLAVQCEEPAPPAAAAAATGAGAAVATGAVAAGRGFDSTRPGSGVGAEDAGAAMLAVGVRSTPGSTFAVLPENGLVKGSEKREASEQPAIRAAAPAAIMSRTATRENAN
jgi:hypothetical protein